jgi:malate dehydrogenase (oxaloacetate-decarboxylating)
MEYEIKSTHLETSLTDYALMANPLLNKGMAFTEQERTDFNLFGLLPPNEATLADQCLRSYTAFKKKETDLDKYIYLRDLQDSNETLFYRLLGEYITELMPIVYTPTVGAGCQQFSHVYRRPRGVFIAYPYRDHIDHILANPRFNSVRAIVVTDGERILGLGDQGAGGMGIPIGKLSLYTACAGIHPATTLPIMLDTGTNNQELLNDPLYIGWRHERVRGQAYDDFVDAFVKAVKKRFPHVLLQWEDFAKANANPILDRYRDQLCTFNDDIQGTAAIATGTLLAAVQITGKKLRDQRIVVVGAGSAGCGISNLMMQAMMEEGLSEAEALAHFFLVDRNGLLVEDLDHLLPFQRKFCQRRNAIANWQHKNPNSITLEEIVKNCRPTVLVGVSGQPGAFTESVIREMAKHVERPIIFPLSNPTNSSEATPTDLIHWTDDRAIIGTGSPFPNVIRDGHPFRIDQTNNAYIFPGLGLGLIAVKAKCVTDKMFMLAAKALANCSPAKNNPKANLLPPLTQIRDVSFQVAFAVAKEAVATGLADPCSDTELTEKIKNYMWTPSYLPYKRK